MQQIQWDDYRSAFQVAQAGSLNKAARQLGCNHTTLLRHINRLEQALNIKLFIRHQRGYRLTDAGQIMVNEMPGIISAFSHLENIMGSVEQDISGNLRITTLVSYSSMLSLVLTQFRALYPRLRIQLITTDEVIPLETGIAHVSLRAGSKPEGSDLIARKLMSIDMAYYAADSYVREHGLPGGVKEFKDHDWVMPSADKQHIPYVKEFLQHIEIDRIVYQSNHIPDIQSAVVAGAGIGMMPIRDADKYKNLHRLEVNNLAKTTIGMLWYVYHRDLKNNAKVKTLYTHLREYLEIKPFSTGAR